MPITFTRKTCKRQEKLAMLVARTPCNLGPAMMGNRIKEAREAKGLSQSELARRVGVSPQTVQQWEANETGPKRARLAKLAGELGASPAWIQFGYSISEEATLYKAVSLMAPQVDGMRPISITPARRITILDYIQAGSPREVVNQYEPGGGMETLTVDEELASELGPHAYALVIEGESMLGEFRPGDHIIIDPDVRPNPGDFVVAKIEVDQAATFKKYRPRGVDKDGNEMFDLVPLNEDYPTIVVNAENRGHVIGTMVEHRRRRRRP